MAKYKDCTTCGNQCLDYTPGVICLFCKSPVDGEERAVPAEILPSKTLELPENTGNKLKLPDNRPGLEARLAWLEENREEVIKDYQTMNLRDFYIKWKLTNARWNYLRDLWQVVSKGKRNRYTDVKPLKKHTGNPLHGFDKLKLLPAFPEFNPTWSDELRIVWLNVYAEIVMEGQE